MRSSRPATGSHGRLRSVGRVVLTGALLLLTLLQPHLGQAEEIRTVRIRGLRIAPDGALRLFVSFRSPQEVAVTTLEPDRLRLELDGRPLAPPFPVQPFPVSGEGTAVLLAIDRSGTMSRGLPRIKEALVRFTETLRPELDRAALGTIGNDWELRLDFTADRELVGRTLGQLEAGSGTTALFESIHLGLELLVRQSLSLPARRFLIVVSDGQNEKRGRTADECIALARQTGTQVHSLIFLTQPTAAQLAAKGELEKISRDTGGLTFTTTEVGALRTGVERLREELNRELVLQVAAAQLIQDGREHTLRVRYDLASADRTYTAPLIAAPQASAPGTATGTPTTGTPTTASSTPQAASATQTPADGWPSWLLLVGGLGGLLLVLALCLLLLLRHARSRTTAAAEPSAAPAAPEPLPAPAPVTSPDDLAGPAAPAPPPPATDHRSPTPAPRRTEFRPAVPPGPGPGDRLRLRVIDGLPGDPILEVPPTGGRLGYEPTNELILNADSVSGRHAEIVRLPTGGWGIRDLWSTNGSFVDGVRVGSQPVPLRPGCELRLGLVRMICE